MILCFCSVFHCFKYAWIRKNVLETANNQRNVGCFCCHSLFIALVFLSKKSTCQKKNVICLSLATVICQLFEYFFLTSLGTCSVL